MDPRTYPAPFATFANSQSHQPPGQYLNSGPGGHLSFQGPLAPLSLSRNFGPPPLIKGFWAIYAPHCLYSPQNVGQGGGPSSLNSRWVPNHKWAHLNLFWPKDQRNQDTQNGNIPQYLSHGLWQSPEATSQFQ
ncbi:hypothetical protein O181_131679 [Austropuccinia psidii MF-1]|uniref:Uncharacterized protein n=1 Tax=Austropuccinia psidii MF-1 TaxID=1389203 RepID=A0A9Q3QBA9_9BASI|nr:hypothetical protein [Austropuccinia psidii MF-1]